jgi:hypothetical protein
LKNNGLGYILGDFPPKTYLVTLTAAHLAGRRARLPRLAARECGGRARPPGVDSMNQFLPEFTGKNLIESVLAGIYGKDEKSTGAEIYRRNLILSVFAGICGQDSME